MRTKSLLSSLHKGLLPPGDAAGWGIEIYSPSPKPPPPTGRGWLVASKQQRHRDLLSVTVLHGRHVLKVPSSSKTGVPES